VTEYLNIKLSGNVWIDESLEVVNTVESVDDLGINASIFEDFNGVESLETSLGDCELFDRFLVNSRLFCESLSIKFTSFLNISNLSGLCCSKF
jgi:hypothetical protein